jgi:ParB family chromosome partitioning protein
VAKTTKSGLGRGLNSLISGSIEEVLPDETAKESAPQPKAQVTEPKASEKEVLTDEKKAETAGASRSTAPTKDSAPKEAPKPEVSKPRFEEDDHVVIRSVKERVPDEVPLASVQPNPDQPRTNFKKEEIEELAASIERNGLLQPVLVRQIGKNYQIIAGERRWQACKMLGMKMIPVRVKEADDDKALELALIENLQRSDLNPIEEAYGIRRLIERCGLSQSEAAETLSKGRSTVANALRLLELPEEAQQLLFEEKISAGHARAILSIPTKEGRQKLTERLINEKISVREAETIARLFAGMQNNQNSSARPVMPLSFKTVARSLRETLQTGVRVKTVQGKNKIEIEFKDEEDLERLFGIISPSEKR